MVRGLPVGGVSDELSPSTRLKTMKTRNFLAIAAFGGLLVAAGCKGKDEYGADSTGTAAMGDTTGMGAAGTTGNTGTMAPTGTITDSTGMTTGTMTDSTSTMGDTIKR